MKIQKLREMLEPVGWDETKLTDEQIVKIVREKNAPTEIPPCPVCGGELSIGGSGCGEPTIYACSPYERDPDGDEGELRLKDGRDICDEHYRKSEFVDRRHADRFAFELARRYLQILEEDE